jgi:hypothetical protein
MFKMGLYDPFGYSKHKLWSKEGLEVNLSIWLSTTKSWELPWFICVQVAHHISLENFQWGLQLCFKPYFNQRFAQKNMGLQNPRSPNLGILGVPDKMHLGASPMAMHKKYYMGKGVVFPQVQAVVNLVSSCLPWLIYASKVFQLCINQLVVWFV